MKMWFLGFLVCFVGSLNLAVGSGEKSRGVNEVNYVDLSYSMGNNTIFYPGARTFQLNKDYEGWRNNGTMWYAGFSFCLGEHGGTHLDAPYHFYKEGWTVDEIPQNHLVNIKVALVNVKHQVDTQEIPGNYKITVEDLMNHEQQMGRIPSKGLVIFYTGWSRFWPDRTKYLGIEQENNIKNLLRFPGLTLEAIKWLSEERQVLGIGIDTPSVDQGMDSTFPVHVYAAAKQIYKLENVANLHLLLDEKTELLNAFVLPVKIIEGTGAPVRILVQTYSTE